MTNARARALERAAAAGIPLPASLVPGGVAKSPAAPVTVTSNASGTANKAPWRAGQPAARTAQASSARAAAVAPSPVARLARPSLGTVVRHGPSVNAPAASSSSPAPEPVVVPDLLAQQAAAAVIKAAKAAMPRRRAPLHPHSHRSPSGPQPSADPLLDHLISALEGLPTPPDTDYSSVSPSSSLLQYKTSLVVAPAPLPSPPSDPEEDDPDAPWNAAQIKSAAHAQQSSNAAKAASRHHRLVLPLPQPPVWV